MGLTTPTSGRLEIAGRDIATLSPDELAALRNKTLGFVFQQLQSARSHEALKQVMLPLL